MTDDQKRARLDIYRYILSPYEDDPDDFIERVVTKDETLTQSQKCRSKNGHTLAYPS